MKIKLLYFLFLMALGISTAQNRFELASQKQKVSIPFQYVNNLIILKVAVNGVVLNMIFDTGIKQTILINVKTTDSLNLNHLKSKKFTGVGADNPIIEGLSSAHNIVQLHNQIVNKDAKIYMIADFDFKFSEYIGVPVNGFIGGELIKNFMVQIDYNKKKLIFYKQGKFIQKKLKKYQVYDLEIVRDKPYVQAFLQPNKKTPSTQLKFLIDTGNSDAVWLFSASKPSIPVTQKRIDDYFGLGFSGDIKGQRIKAARFGFDTKHKFKNVYVALPDSIYFRSVIRNFSFDGLIGNEVLRRFKVIFDFRHKKLYLKKNRNFYHDKFLFNDTGIFLIYDGKIVVKQKQIETYFETDVHNNKTFVTGETAYTFVYKMLDRIVIQYIRKGSPADRAGLMEGDILLEINGQSVYDYRLDELEKRFFYHNKKHLRFLIERKGMRMEYNILNTKQL